MTSRIFKRLSIACNHYQPHTFFLERMANAQWNNSGIFTAGPFIILEPTHGDSYMYWKVAGQIDCALQYYMKPYSTSFFGTFDTFNLKQEKYLLTRLWIHRDKNGNNNMLSLMEYFENNKIEEYMNAINNRSWQPIWPDILHMDNIKICP